MAKLKAPLLSLGASGAIGKSVVFFNWKGLDVAREFVVPANPKSTDQTTQRGYLTAAIAKIHAVQADADLPLAADDEAAYRVWASTFPTPRTWFNQAVKAWLDCKVADKVPIVYGAGACLDSTHLDYRPSIYFWQETLGSLASGKFYLGTTKTALINVKAATLVPDQSVSLPAFGGYDNLTAGVKYFWQFRPDTGDPCEGADSGIYCFEAT